MDEEKNLLVTKRFKLARLIRADPIVSLLAAQRHISPHSAAKIQCKRSGFERNVALLTELSRRPRCSVEAFAKALLVTGQKHASDVLIMHNRLLHRTMTLHRGWDEADGSKRFVVPTDVEFYNRTKHDSYAMVSTPRGYALIIIVKSDVTLQANLNKSNLEELLLQLGYICNTIEVLSVSDAMNAIEEFSLKDKHKDVDSSVVSLLHNEQLPERDADNIVNMFDNSKCAHLRNKPKIFLLPAPVHSGRNYPLVQKRHLTCSSDLAESTSARLPTSSDFIVVLLHIGTAGRIAFGHARRRL